MPTNQPIEDAATATAFKAALDIGVADVSGLGTAAEADTGDFDAAGSAAAAQAAAIAAASTDATSKANAAQAAAVQRANHTGEQAISTVTGLQTALDGKAPSIVTPVSVANAAARKSAATYTAAEVTPVNGLRVIQTDLPDVVWTLLSTADITADANWAGHPRTNAAGALPLSNVKVIDGNVPFSFSQYIPVSDSRWLQSSATTYDAIPLFAGIKIPGSLMVAGNKIAVTGSYRYFKDSAGIASDMWLTFGPQALWDESETNPATEYLATAFFPRVAIAVESADVQGVGIFHAVFTMTATTSVPANIYLVADTNFADGGSTSAVDGAASFEALPAPQSMSDVSGPVAHYPAGEDAEISLGLLGAANAKTKSWRVAVTGGVHIFEP